MYGDPVRAFLEGDQLLYELGMLIGRSRRLVWTAASRELESNGFSALAWVLGTYLLHNGLSTQREIATAIGQHPAGVSRLVDELETKGLVRRRRDAKDRRRAHVELTARGRKMAEAGRPHVIGALHEALGPLSKGELLRLYRLLHKLVPTAPLLAVQPISRNSRSGSSR
jgi:DNA-binding MarR family transcriptional regulator